MSINISVHVNSSMTTYVQHLICSNKVTGSSNLTIPVDITIWKFFQSIQSSLAALGWLMVPVSFFKFTVLPFSLSIGPFIFTNIQKALTKHWRRQGIRLFTYLDDGAGADSDFSEAQRVSDMVRADVWRSGFVANDAKSQWVPVQSGELLGYVLNLHAGTFQVPQRRVDAFYHVLRDVIAHKFVVSARMAARFTGLLASMSLALGPVVRADSLFRLGDKWQWEVGQSMRVTRAPPSGNCGQLV